MKTRELYIIGYGSQASAWAQNLRDSGVEVQIFLRNLDSKGAKESVSNGFAPIPLENLSQVLQKNSNSTGPIALLCSDSAIPEVYDRYISPSLRPLQLVLAHGLCIYNGSLKPRTHDHEIFLFAPKSIGPELRKAFLTRDKNKPHSLVAAIHAPKPTRLSLILELGQAMGFNRDNLIECHPRLEAMADLLSEQWVLCGTLFSQIQWTMEEMRKFGVPERLIHTECIEELGLIASMLKANGVEGTISRISQTAKEGAAMTKEKLIKAGIPELIRASASELQKLGETTK